jgi:hypothetical protein
MRAKNELQQLGEAYQSIQEGLPGVTGGAHSTSREIPSEEFNVENQYGNATTYAIFVGVDSLPHFQKIVQQKGFEGLQFLKMADPDLDKDGNPQEQGVITMPAYESGGASHSPREIRDELYKHNPPDNEFWGQQGVGYAGKHWIPVV